MKKYLTALFAALLLMTLSTGAYAGQDGKSSGNARVLKMPVHYAGAGTVDEKHKIYVFVFNSTDFMQGDGQPVASSTTTSKEETATFSDLTDSPVYVAVVYDPNGAYDGQSQPPSGSSTAIYSKTTPGTPEPIVIDSGKTVELAITFDDTHKMR